MSQSKGTSRKKPVRGLQQKRGKKIQSKGYKSLTVKNNWGNLEYYFGKTRIQTVTPKGMVSLKVKGVEYDVKVRFKEGYTTVSDHGQNHSVTFQKLQIQIEVFDQKVWINCDEVKGLQFEQSEWTEYVSG